MATAGVAVEIDDEAWYSAMVEAGSSCEPPGEQHKRPKSEINDETWAEAMMAASASSAVRDLEDGAAWEDAARSLIGLARMGGDVAAAGNTVASFFKVEGGAATLLVARWLRQNRPHSEPWMYRLERRQANDPTEFFVDSLADPTAIVTLRLQDGSRLQTLSVFSLSSAAAAALLGAVAVPNVSAVLEHVDAAIHEETLDKVLQRATGLSQRWADHCGFYALRGGRLPEGNYDALMVHEVLGDHVTFGPLTADDAPIVNDHWRFKKSGSLEMTEAMIARGPTVGARVDGQLASWCLVYHDLNALGMLFTRKEWRGRGLAKAVVIRLLRECGCVLTGGSSNFARAAGAARAALAAAAGSPAAVAASAAMDADASPAPPPASAASTPSDIPYALMADPNITSISLFKQLGFQWVSASNWMGYAAAVPAPGPPVFPPLQD
ncbi:unnamed protein product [Phaeothamnion confervicola]